MTIEQAILDFVAEMAAFGDGAHTRGLAMREIVETALGRDGAARALSLQPPEEQDALKPLLEVEAGDLAILLENEQPAAIAVVLSLLPAERAAQVLAKLPEAERGTSLRALSSLASLAPTVIDDVISGLTEQLKRFVQAGKRRPVDGLSAAVAILRRMPGESQRQAVDEIERTDADLAEKMRGKMLAFEDIAQLSRKEIQLFLQTCDARTLSLALKGAPESTTNRLLANMSQRAAASFREEMEMLGRVRLSQVEQAQTDLVKVVLRLADEGKVALPNGAEKMLS